MRSLLFLIGFWTWQCQFSLPACRAKWKQFEHCISQWVHWHLRIAQYTQNQHVWQVSDPSHDLRKLLPPSLQKFIARSNMIHIAKPTLEWQPSRDPYLGINYFSCASLGGMVEKWRHNWSRRRSELLYYYWSQPDHQASPPLRYCKLYLCRQKHCCQEEKHNGNCHRLWWVSCWVGTLVHVKLQFPILIWNIKQEARCQSPLLLSSSFSRGQWEV